MTDCSAAAYCPFGKRDYYPEIHVHYTEHQPTKPPRADERRQLLSAPLLAWCQSNSSLLDPAVAVLQTHTRFAFVLMLVACFLLLLVLDGLMGSAAQVPDEGDPEHAISDHQLAVHAGTAAIKEMHRQFTIFMGSHESL